MHICGITRDGHLKITRVPIVEIIVTVYVKLSDILNEVGFLFTINITKRSGLKQDAE